MLYKIVSNSPISEKLKKSLNTALETFYNNIEDRREKVYLKLDTFLLQQAKIVKLNFFSRPDNVIGWILNAFPFIFLNELFDEQAVHSKFKIFPNDVEIQRFIVTLKQDFMNAIQPNRNLLETFRYHDPQEPLDPSLERLESLTLTIINHAENQLIEDNGELKHTLPFGIFWNEKLRNVFFRLFLTPELGVELVKYFPRLFSDSIKDFSNSCQLLRSSDWPLLFKPSKTTESYHELVGSINKHVKQMVCHCAVGDLSGKNLFEALLIAKKTQPSTHSSDTPYHPPINSSFYPSNIQAELQENQAKIAALEQELAKVQFMAKTQRNGTANKENLRTDPQFFEGRQSLEESELKNKLNNTAPTSGESGNTPSSSTSIRILEEDVSDEVLTLRLALIKEKTKVPIEELFILIHNTKPSNKDLYEFFCNYILGKKLQNSNDLNATELGLRDLTDGELNTIETSKAFLGSIPKFRFFKLWVLAKENIQSVDSEHLNSFVNHLSLKLNSSGVSCSYENLKQTFIESKSVVEFISSISSSFPVSNGWLYKTQESSLQDAMLELYKYSSLSPFDELPFFTDKSSSLSFNGNDRSSHLNHNIIKSPEVRLTYFKNQIQLLLRVLYSHFYSEGTDPLEKETLGQLFLKLNSLSSKINKESHNHLHFIPQFKDLFSRFLENYFSSGKSKQKNDLLSALHQLICFLQYSLLANPFEMDMFDREFFQFYDEQTQFTGVSFSSKSPYFLTTLPITSPDHMIHNMFRLIELINAQFSPNKKPIKFSFTDPSEYHYLVDPTQFMVLDFIQKTLLSSQATDFDTMKETIMNFDFSELKTAMIAEGVGLFVHKIAGVNNKYMVKYKENSLKLVDKNNNAFGSPDFEIEGELNRFGFELTTPYVKMIVNMNNTQYIFKDVSKSSVPEIKKHSKEHLPLMAALKTHEHTQDETTPHSDSEVKTRYSNLSKKVVPTTIIFNDGSKETFHVIDFDVEAFRLAGYIFRSENTFVSAGIRIPDPCPSSSPPSKSLTTKKPSLGGGKSSGSNNVTHRIDPNDCKTNKVGKQHRLPMKNPGFMSELKEKALLVGGKNSGSKDVPKKPHPINTNNIVGKQGPNKNPGLMAELVMNVAKRKTKNVT